MKIDDKDLYLVYQYAYYVNATPLISDFEFDMFEKQVFGEEKPNVGADNANDYPFHIRTLWYYIHTKNNG